MAEEPIAQPDALVGVDGQSKLAWGRGQSVRKRGRVQAFAMENRGQTDRRSHHWRAHSGSEVDLLLERDGMLYPIEVNMGTRPSRNDTRGIQSLRTTYPAIQMAPGLVIGPVERFERLSEFDYAAPWDMI